MPANHTLRIFLFGFPRMEVDGTIFHLPQRDTFLRLFIRLVLQAGQSLSRKNLAFSLWAEENETDALANLRRHLYLLRNAIPESFQITLVITTQTVLLQLPPNTWVDVVTFEQKATSLPEMESATNLYTGDLAQGANLDDFLLIRREELRIRYLSLLKTLAQTHLENKQYEASIRWSRKLTAHDPWDEEAIRLYMTTEAILGNRAAALTAYKTLEDNLRHEIDAQPMPETMSLYRDILHNHIPRSSHGKTDEWLPFISRENEITLLGNAIHDVQERRGGFIFINGPAGVGKTTLVREIAHRFLDVNTVRLFWGNCQPTEVERPYSLWKQIFNVAAPLLAHQENISTEWLNELLPLIPDLSLLRSNLIPPSRPDSAELHTALRQGLYALAEIQPLVLVIEDAHWMDTASLEFLNELATGVFQHPILFLVTHRTENPPLTLLELKRTLRRKRAAQDLHLQAFTLAETQAFLESALKVEHISTETLTEVSRYAEGIPLLLREATQILRRQKQTQITSDTLPSLRESFRMRLKNLIPSAREMLEAAAVLGYSLLDNELRSTLQWKPEAHAAALDILQSERLLIENTQLGTDEYSFSHHLIHQIILHEIPSARAKHLRACVAQALEHIHGDETGFAAEIAYQYEQAGLSLPAARFWLKHAQENMDLAAFEAGQASITRAEELLTNADHQAQELRTQATLQRGVIAFYQGHGEIALNLLEQAVTQARPFPSLFANALSMQAYALYTRDQSEAANHSADQAFTLSIALNNIPNAVSALNIRAVSAMMMGRTQNAIDDLHHALSLLDQNQLTASAQTVQSLNHLGTALVFAQDYPQACQILDRTVELSNQGGLCRVESAALTMLGQVALNCGRYEQSIYTYSRAIEVAGSSYLPGMWGKFAGRGWAYLRTGNLTAARKDFTHGLDVAMQVESRYGRILMRCYLTFTSLAAGEIPPTSLSDLEAEAASLNLHPVVLFAANAQGQLWRILQDEQKAQAAHVRAVTAAHASNVPSFIQLVRLQEMLTQAVQAKDIDISELTILHQSVLTSGEAPLQVLARLIEAYSLFSNRRIAEALSATQQALTLARSLPDQQLIGECLLLLTRLYTKLNEKTMAETCRTEIRILASSTFAPLWIELGEDRATMMRENIVKILSCTNQIK